MSAGTQFPIRIAEELILLMLDEQSGYLEMVPGWDFSCVMAGAVLADLALERRIETDLERLYLVDSNPTGDDLLDPTLKDIAASEEKSDAQFWIERNTRHADEIVAATLDRLVARNILTHQTGGFWGLSRDVSRSGTYPTQANETRGESKARVLSVILNDEIPDPRDAILVALMHTCGGFKLLLEEEDYEERLDRIELVARLDLIGRTVAAAVKDSTAKPKTRRVLQTRPIPRLGFLGFLRQRDLLSGNIPKAMYGIYRKHGPVVRMPFKIQGAPVVALMGPDVNRWVNRHGRFYLRSKDYIERLENAFGASRSMPGMDGAEHYRMRKSLQSAYSRATLARRLPELIDNCRTSLGRWRQGDVFRGAEGFQHHVSSQISHLTMGVDCSHYVDELLAFEHRALVTRVQGTLPEFMLSTPRMKRYGKHVRRLQEAITASHTPAQRKGKPRDIADALLDLHKSDPQFLPETDLTFPFVAAMVASIYLGSGLAFAVYNMVRHPEVYARIRGEAESLFGNGREPNDDDFSHDSVDVTVRLCMESSRMYPVIPWQLRTVMNECVVSGYGIPTNTMTLICQTVPHYSDELYKDPLKFDIDRYLPDRAEHLKPGAYAPYGLGTHMCLGHRWVELQMAVNVLLIAHHLQLEVAPDNYRMGINPFPTLAPNRKLKFRVARITHPI
ncbi:MAG: cytochrome P450 [Acidobacteria bacterium]|nr:cytochrome P450 [Acidobacteriota bacterium]